MSKSARRTTTIDLGETYLRVETTSCTRFGFYPFTRLYERVPEGVQSRALVSNYSTSPGRKRYVIRFLFGIYARTKTTTRSE